MKKTRSKKSNKSKKRREKERQAFVAFATVLTNFKNRLNEIAARLNDIELDLLERFRIDLPEVVSANRES